MPNTNTNTKAPNVYLDNSPTQSTCLNAVSATGAGTALNVSEYQTVVVMVEGNGSFDGTLKIRGCAETNPPSDWTASQSTTNFYTDLSFADLAQAGTITAGATGLVMTNAANFYQLEVNVNLMVWINVVVTTRNAGTVSVYLRPSKGAHSRT